MGKFITLLQAHKLKIGAGLLSFIIFFVLLFPLGDLGDMISSKIAENFQNQVFVQFQNLGLSLFPQAGIEMTGVTVNTTYFPEVKADSMILSPSIIGMLTFKPGISLEARGIMKGGISLSTRGGDKNQQGIRKQNISLALEKIELKDLSTFIQLPVSLDGRLNFETKAEIDPSWQDQPDATVNLNAESFHYPGGNIPTQLGPMNFPELALKKLIVEGELKKGKLTLDKTELGEVGDDLHAKLKGQMEIRINGAGAGVSYNAGAYDLSVELTVKQTLVDKFGILFNQIEGYKKPGPNGSSYAFRISSPDFATFPKLSNFQ